MVFWIMLIWIVFVMFFLRYRFTSKIICEDGAYEYKAYRKFMFLLFSVPMVFVIFRTEFIDTSSYINTFELMPTDFSQFKYIQKFNEAGLYYGVQFAFKSLISDNPSVWLGVIALIQAFLVAHTIRKYSCDPGLSMFLFMSSGLLASWMCNGVRQFIVVSILFACTEWVVQNKWYYCLPLAVFLMGFGPIANFLKLGEVPWFLDGIHESVLIVVLAFFFVNGKAFNKRLWLLAVLLLVLIFTGGLDKVLNTSVVNTTYITDMENVDADTGTNVYRVIVQAAPLVMAVFAYKEIKSPDTPKLINVAVNCSFVSTLLYIASGFTSAIYVGRLPVYFEMYNIILIPWLLAHPYKANRKLFTAMIMLAYTAYFFYQVNVTWADVPYHSSFLGI